MIIFSIIIASLVSMTLGALWYSKFFGQMWMSLSGLTSMSMDNEAKNAIAKRYVVQVIFTLFTAMTLSHFARVLSVTTIAGGFELAAWIWLGFQIPLLIHPVLFEKKPVMLFVLHSSYYFLVTLLMSLAIVLIA